MGEWLEWFQWKDTLIGFLLVLSSCWVVKISFYLFSVRCLKEGIISSDMLICEVVFSIYSRIGFLFLPSLAFRIIQFITQGGKICASDSLLLSPTYFEDSICLLDAVYRNSFICLVILQAFFSSISKLVFLRFYYDLSAYSFASFQMLISSWIYELLGVFSTSIILDEPLSLGYIGQLACFYGGITSFSCGLYSFYRKSIFRLDEGADVTCLGMDCFMVLISLIISFIFNSYYLFLLQYSSMFVLEGEFLYGELFTGETSLYFLLLLTLGVIQCGLSFAAGLKKLLFLADALSQLSLKT